MPNELIYIEITSSFTVWVDLCASMRKSIVVEMEWKENEWKKKNECVA